MKKALAVLNELEAAGILHRYAIGGAMATMFYPIEPAETEDLDILILLPPEKRASLDPLDSLHADIVRRGYTWDGPYLSIEGVPVQFLPAYNPLVEEAIEQAVEMPYDDEVTTRVPTPEHLIAIMLDTGRAKDRGRFEQMRAHVSLDAEKLDRIISRHGLKSKFAKWTEP